MKTWRSSVRLEQQPKKTPVRSTECHLANASITARGASARNAGDRRYASITAAGASARNAGDRRYASMTAAGASARSAWGRAYAPTSARRASARNAGDRAYASMTAAGASARGVWGRASAPTSASIVHARIVAAAPRTCLAWIQAGVHQRRSGAREQGACRGLRIRARVGRL